MGRGAKSLCDVTGGVKLIHHIRFPDIISIISLAIHHPSLEKAFSWQLLGCYCHLLVKATIISEPVKHSLVIACSRSVAKMSLHNNSEEEDKMHYPRTGKRGVPQQFPRKLYEMLEVESGSDCVSWTASGRGFRITNTSLFSERVLPKWFKVQNIGHTTLVCFICWRVTQQHITSVTHTCQDV